MSWLNDTTLQGPETYLKYLQSTNPKEALESECDLHKQTQTGLQAIKNNTGQDPAENSLVSSPIKGIRDKLQHQTKGPTSTPKVTKIRYDLVPPEVIHALAETLTINCENGRYPERDWEGGRSWAGEFAAVMRHMWKWWNPRVPNVDEETGLSHLYHAVTRLSFLIAYEEQEKYRVDVSVYMDKPK